MRLAKALLGCGVAACVAGGVLAATGASGGSAPTARVGSGQGQVLVVGRDSRNRPVLYLMRGDGSRRRLPGSLIPRGVDGISPDWSPDGRRIAFSAARPTKGQPARDIYVTDLNGPPQQITHTKTDADPAWSPDGSRIAFSREVPAPEGEWQRAELWTMNPDGSDQRRITQGSWDAIPVWSPDGGRLAFTKFSFDTKTSTFHQALYVMPAGGGTPRLVSNDSAAAAWSPDGSRLAVLDERDHNGDDCYDECTINDELYVMNADGSNPVRLTHTKASEGTAVWSPDGTRILFSSNLNYPETGGHEIYSIAASGGCPIRLTNDSAGLYAGGWRPGSGPLTVPKAGRCRHGYRSTGRKALFHTDLRPAKRFHRFPLYWLGRSFDGLLLNGVDATASGGMPRVYFLYDDCGRNPGKCGPALQMLVEPTCQSVAPRDAGGNPHARDRVIRLRGALVQYRTATGRFLRGELQEGTIFTGGVAVRAFEASPARVLAIARHLRRFGHRRGSRALSPPRLPASVIRHVRRTEDLVKQLGVRGAVKRLHSSTGVVRFRLRLAAVLRRLPETQPIGCPRLRQPKPPTRQPKR